MDEDFRWYNDVSKQFLVRDYLLPGWTLSKRVEHIAQTAEDIVRRTGHSQNETRHVGLAGRILHAVQRGWWSFSTPVWANFGLKRGLPISCFGSHIGDSIASMMRGVAEIGLMSKHGGGTAAYFGAIRPRGEPISDNGYASGPMHYLPMWESVINIVTQGATRNANMSAWMDVEHRDIMDFLQIMTDHHPIQKLHPGICVGDEWMNKVRDGDAASREIFAEMITQRNNTGHPYILFRDTVNRNTVDVYRDKDMPIRHSNLCTEICLPTDDEESFVCCLSSLNLAHYAEWKDTDTISDLIMFLDAVMTDFIERGESVAFMERPVRFAKRHRALGIGVLGWHSLLQSRMLSWGSMEATMLNASIFRMINTRAWEASRRMAQTHGEPELLQGYGRRHTTLTAIAPTLSSATILGQVSKGIEPFLDNYHVVDTDKLKYTFRNSVLERVLADRGYDDHGTWDSILRARGSVQHLQFLSDHERDVFRTMSEISPMDMIVQAAARQKHVDQSQSLNLCIHPSISTKDRVALMMAAWEKGIKTLYYQENENASQEFSRNVLQCSVCAA